jgi:hypothetical protein
MMFKCYVQIQFTRDFLLYHDVINIAKNATRRKKIKSLVSSESG